MDVGTTAGRETSIVIEKGTRSALVNGTRLELAPTDFALLTALAERRGEVLSQKELAEIAFGGPTSPGDLYWRIWNLRKMVGDLDRKPADMIIRNRRGQGYVLELSEASVEVVHRIPDASAEDPVDPPAPADDQAIPSEAPPPTPVELVQPATDEPPSPEIPTTAEERQVTFSEAPLRALRPRAVLLATAIALAALGSSWSVGYLLAAKPGAETRVGSVSQLPEGDPSPSPEKTKDTRQRKDQKDQSNKPDRDKRPTKTKKDRPGKPNGVAVLAAPPATPAEVADPAPEPKPQTNDGKDSGESKPQPVAPALPAAPTRYLYHLVHPETGDHFVTTDSATASEQEAKGYRGSAIARIYTSQESGTRALTTNQGTAWIFTSAGPKTEPASRPVPLWYSTNDAGDFFYTTSESEAKASGWSASLAGYARAL